MEKPESPEVAFTVKHIVPADAKYIAPGLSRYNFAQSPVIDLSAVKISCSDMHSLLLQLLCIIFSPHDIPYRC